MTWAAALLRDLAMEDPREAARRALEAGRAHGSEVQLLRPDAVVGPRHVASAAEHALRAWAQGRGRAQSLGVELVCYLAADGQIARALPAVGLPPGAREAVGVALGGAPRDALGAVAAALGARLDWALQAHGHAAFAALGWTALPGDPERQALERVALLDAERGAVTRPAGGTKLL